jgi:hypothetical protein
MKNSENLLNVQPSPEEAERQELESKIKDTKDVSELVELVYESGNGHLIRAYHETRLAFLKEIMPETMAEYVDVTKEGFLSKEKIDGDATETADHDKHEPISAIDAINVDSEYLEQAIPELLDALNISDYDDLKEAA